MTLTMQVVQWFTFAWVSVGKITRLSVITTIAHHKQSTHTLDVHKVSIDPMVMHTHLYMYIHLYTHTHSREGEYIVLH